MVRSQLKTSCYAIWLVVTWLLGFTTMAQPKSPVSTPKPMRLLIFSKTAGFRHKSIAAGQVALAKLAKEKGFLIDTTENSETFTETNLKQYKAIVFLNTTGDILNDAQQADFERYIQAGGGFVGVHAATDTEHKWPWYNKLVGGYFASHPNNPNVQKGTMYVLDKNHPSTKDLPDQFDRTDEFYDFSSYQKDLVKPLIRVDEKSYHGGKMGDFHPLVWYHEFDGGKVFYTNFGHTDESYTEEIVLKSLWGGIQYVTNYTSLDYTKAKTERAPEENRFIKKVLINKLEEPTELVVLADGKVLFTERRGLVKLYNPKNQQTKVVASLSVYHNFEYGLMGINVDADFATNKWVYLYYSNNSAPDTTNRLSRFKFDTQKDTLLMQTEQIILRVPIKRTECCHTGGSITFDKQGNLFLSTGDDTNAFTQKGYAPIDERPDRDGWDAQTTSANTNDLRGKILRIRIKEDGTYTIPEGNLFAPGTPKTRPEIYVMGNRNPYRISVDQHTGYLYWGEIGPDAGENSETRGPKGYDEINQARKAGFFGWPFFVADNKPYRDYNFADSTSGELFNPEKPINDSPHNTGLKELPPAQKAFIWYPYADSKEFPLVGKGSRNAMAGEVYYMNDYQRNTTSFPSYYDGKLFIYDWARDWIMTVTLNDKQGFQSMNPFMAGTKFYHVIDMQFAKDGSLYTLEYGPNWFVQNDEATLSHITFNTGNRTPVAVATASKKVGSVPLTVAFSSKGSQDYDNDALKYEWTFGHGMPKSTLPSPTITFTKPGIYKPVLKVTDAKGNSHTTQLEIKVGNDIPKVDIAVNGNKTFFWNDQAINYEVKVQDKEDGDLAKGTIAPQDVALSINYLEGFDKTTVAQGHQANAGFLTGKRLLELSDCQACHAMDKKSVGPSYMDIARKYPKASDVVPKLTEKVIKGGGGVWGEQPMSAHPQLKFDEAREMVRYILSLDDTKPRKPLKGSYMAKEKQGAYIFTASYTDKGKGEVGPLTTQKSVTLRSATLPATAYDGANEVQKVKNATGNESILALASNSYVSFKDLDMTGIASVSCVVSAASPQHQGGTLEIHVGSPTGKLLGQTSVQATGTHEETIRLITPVTGMQTIYFVCKTASTDKKPLFAIDSLSFQKSTTAQSMK